MSFSLTLLILCKDNPSELKRTLLSVISCDLSAKQQNEVEVVVLDSSSDSQCKKVYEIMAAELPNSRIEYTPATGIYPAKKRGLNLSRGDFIQFLNSGDIYANERGLSVCIEAINENSPNGCNLIYYDSCELNLDNTITFCPSREPAAIVEQSLFRLECPYWHEFPRTASCLLRASCLSINIDGLKIAEDHRFLLSIIAASAGADCIHISDVLTVYEVGGYSWQSPIEGAYERCLIQQEFFRGDPRELQKPIIEFMMHNLRAYIENMNSSSNSN